jgi:VWFA-related protein
MRRLFVLLLPLLALAPGARAADDAPPSFGESIDVRVVNVEAVVTDRQGNRVSGLRPEDFRLRVDGREVPVEFFSEVRDGEALPAPTEGSPAPSAQAAARAAVQGVAEGRVGTYYLLYIDDYFSVGAQRNTVLQALKADLGRLGPDDRMAVVAYNGGRLTMLSNWSGSPADLGRAFDQAMARGARGSVRRAERTSSDTDEAFLELASAADGDAPLPDSAKAPGMSPLQRLYAVDLMRQVRGDVQAVVSAMRAFAAPRGRKVMLLLSGGWPFSIQSYAGRGGGQPTKELPEGEEVFRPLANTANLLGYTLYPVDVPGIQSGASDITAAAPPMPKAPGRVNRAGIEAASPGDLQVAVDVGAGNVPEGEVEGSLKYLAKETGGKALLNTNRGLALATAREDTRSFYWLGFSPAWQHDDKRHDIRLEARRSGLTVRTRSGFLDLSRKAEVAMMVESALLFGSPPGALRMPLTVGEVVRSKQGELEIPVTLGLPVDLMTVVPEGSRYTVHLELRFAASDATGDTADVPVVPVTLTSDHQPSPGKLVKYETRVKLRGKADHMVVAAYDPLSGKIATAEVDVKAP